MAFCFGLLHGFGFAGALASIALPQQAISLALFCFNVGVEIGQLIFVALILTAVALLKRLSRQPPDWARWVTPYAIGGIASFWLVERVVAFWQ